jgi:hypothetical protein
VSGARWLATWIVCPAARHPAMTSIAPG